MRRALASVVLLGVLGCGSTSSTVDAGALLHQTNLSANHLATCDDPGCGNGASLPLGGDHCRQVASCRVYDTAQPRCRWLHNLEHGHAVLLYNCPAGCQSDVDALTQLRAASPQSARIILAPEPTLPDRFAAVVWGWGWMGPTLDLDQVRAVLAKQDAEAPEALLSCPP